MVSPAIAYVPATRAGVVPTRRRNRSRGRTWAGVTRKRGSVMTRAWLIRGRRSEMNGRKLMISCMLLLVCSPAFAQTVTYVHTDALGSLVLLTDANRNVVERREYEPYGRQLTPAPQDGPGYTGHVYDAATGMVYRSEEHTYELQSLMRISYAVFC